jgi:hypothetical protein
MGTGIGTESDLQSMFGDLGGQQEHFPDGIIMPPSNRLPGLHAIASRMARHVEPDSKIPMHPLIEAEELVRWNSDDVSYGSGVGSKKTNR